MLKEYMANETPCAYENK